MATGRASRAASRSAAACVQLHAPRGGPAAAQPCRSPVDVGHDHKRHKQRQQVAVRLSDCGRERRARAPAAAPAAGAGAPQALHRLSGCCSTSPPLPQGPGRVAGGCLTPGGAFLVEITGVQAAGSRAAGRRYQSECNGNGVRPRASGQGRGAGRGAAGGRARALCALKLCAPRAPRCTFAFAGCGRQAHRLRLARQLPEPVCGPGLRARTWERCLGRSQSRSNTSGRWQ